MSDKLTITDLEKHIAEYLTITEGVASLEKGVQENCFKELGTSTAAVKKAYDDTAMVENAIASVFSTKAIDYMAENESCSIVTAELKVGEEKLHLDSRRDWVTSNPKTGVKTNHKGALIVRRTISNRSSELKDIKTLARERGHLKL